MSSVDETENGFFSSALLFNPNLHVLLIVSMFGGLEVRGDDEEAAPPSDMASGFSFLATSSGVDTDETETASGFSFLSTTAVAAADESAGVSGFSFMTSSPPDQAIAETHQDEPVTASSSGFSFLNVAPPVEDETHQVSIVSTSWELFYSNLPRYMWSRPPPLPTFYPVITMRMWEKSNLAKLLQPKM